MVLKFSLFYGVKVNNNFLMFRAHVLHHLFMEILFQTSFYQIFDILNRRVHMPTFTVFTVWN